MTSASKSKLEALKEKLRERGYENAKVFENPDYTSAVVGVDEDGRVVYSYEKMVKHLVKKDKMTEEEAMEFIDYNTIRALPYEGKKRPIVVYSLKD